ncbi:MAG: S9 family peptidase [Desulfurococcales archaeon]|nr:S9 family peptidase [Desulfurococcales archaeon]
MEKLKPRDIERITIVSAPIFSIGGERYLFTVTRTNYKENKYETSIWLGEEDQYKPLTKGPNDKCPIWGPGPDTITFTSSRDESKETGIYVSMIGGEPWKLASFKGSASIVGWTPEHDNLIVIASTRKDEKPLEERERWDITSIPPWFNGPGWIFDRKTILYKISYPGGVKEKLSREDQKVITASVAKHANMVAYAVSRNELEPYQHTLLVLDLETGTEKVVLDGYTIASIEWSPDGDKLAIRASRRNNGVFSHYHIYIVDIESGEIQCVTCSLDLNTIGAVNSDVRGPVCRKNLYWADDGSIYFIIHKAGSTQIYRSSPDYEEPEHVLGQDNAVIDEFSVDTHGGLQIIYTLMTPTMPKELYIWDEAEGSRRITIFNSWIEDLQLTEPAKYTISGAEGEPIDFWILMPKQQPDCEKCTPWILYIHGGPKTSYGYGFIYEFQLLASNGIAVVYGNPHGSDGYTEEFADLRRRFGTVDYEDLILIADNAPLVEQRLDPERSAVGGGSYGGWMTNYIITRTNRFKAAISQRGCSNWTSFYGASDIGWYFASDVTGSTPWSDPQEYIRISPLFHADKIKTPTLIIHSLEDYRCPLDQAIQLYTALKVNGVKTKLVLFPKENHDLSRTGSPKRKIARLEAILEWLAEHLDIKSLKPKTD